MMIVFLFKNQNYIALRIANIYHTQQRPLIYSSCKLALITVANTSNIFEGFCWENGCFQL